MRVKVLFDTYSFIFSRKYFYKLNRSMYYASLRGLGILNYENDLASGEDKFRRQYLSHLPTPTVVDVGANEGSFSSSVLALNSGARVFAFEPHPQTYRRLVSRMEGRKNFTAINAACGSSPGSLTLYDYKGSSGTGHASLHAGVIEGIHKGDAEGHVVEIVTLDSVMETCGISTIDLLKIDTEGHEFEVLKGATKLLRDNRIKAIQFEFNEMNVASRVFFRDFRELLHGHRFFRLVRDGLIPLDPYSPLLCELFAFQNIVALPEAHPEARGD